MQDTEGGDDGAHLMTENGVKIGCVVASGDTALDGEDLPNFLSPAHVLTPKKGGVGNRMSEWLADSPDLTISRMVWRSIDPLRATVPLQTGRRNATIQREKLLEKIRWL